MDGLMHKKSKQNRNRNRIKWTKKATPSQKTISIYIQYTCNTQDIENFSMGIPTAQTVQNPHTHTAHHQFQNKYKYGRLVWIFDI